MPLCQVLLHRFLRKMPLHPQAAPSQKRFITAREGSSITLCIHTIENRKGNRKQQTQYRRILARCFSGQIHILMGMQQSICQRHFPNGIVWETHPNPRLIQQVELHFHHSFLPFCSLILFLYHTEGTSRPDEQTAHHPAAKPVLLSA